MINNNTIAFLPGWGFSALVWQQLASKLPSHFQPYFCELPSISTETNYHADALPALMQQLKASLPNACTLVGWSLGGLIASLLCQQFPNHFKKLVLVASTPQFVACERWAGTPPSIAKQFKLEAKNNIDQLLEKFIHLVAAPEQEEKLFKRLQPHLLNGLHSTHLLFYLDLLLKTSAHESFSQLSLPTLQIYGSHDHILPRSCAKQLTGLHPHTTTHLIHGAGHAPFLSHQPEFLGALLPFLEQTH